MNRNRYFGEDHSIVIKIKKSIDQVSVDVVYLFASLLTTTKYVSKKHLKKLLTEMEHHVILLKPLNEAGNKMIFEN